MKVTYEVDPNMSMVKDENVILAHYLKDQHLQIEIYDADAKFHYASCKLPLNELLRQSKSQVIRAKECEICAPDTAEYRGSIQLVMSNVGKVSSKKSNDNVNAIGLENGKNFKIGG